MLPRQRMENGLEIIREKPELLRAKWSDDIQQQQALLSQYQSLDPKKANDLEFAVKLLKLPNKQLPAGRRAREKAIAARLTEAIKTISEKISELETQINLLSGSAAKLKYLKFASELLILKSESKTEVNFLDLLKKHNLTWHEMLETLIEIYPEEKLYTTCPENLKEEMASVIAVDTAQAEILNSMTISGDPQEIVIKQSFIENLKCAIKIKELVSVQQYKANIICFINKKHYADYRKESIFYPPAANIFKLFCPIPAEILLTLFSMDISAAELNDFKINKPDISHVIRSNLPELEEKQVDNLAMMIGETRASVMTYLDNAVTINNEILQICASLNINFDFKKWRKEIFDYVKSELDTNYNFAENFLSNLIIKRQFAVIKKALSNPGFHMGSDYKTFVQTYLQEMNVADFSNFMEFPTPDVAPVVPAKLKQAEPENIYPVSAHGLYLAAKDGNDSEVLQLLKRKTLRSPSVADYVDESGKNALLIACVFNHLKVVKLLLNNRFFDVMVTDANGASAFELTTDEKIKKILLQHRMERIKKEKHVVDYPLLESVPQTDVAKFKTDEQAEKIVETPSEDYQASFDACIQNYENYNLSLLLITIDQKTEKLHQAEEKIPENITSEFAEIKARCLALQQEKKYCDDEASLIFKKNSANDMQPEIKSRQKLLIKQFKKLLKSTAHAHKALAEINKNLEEQIEKLPPPDSTTETEKAIVRLNPKIILQHNLPATPRLFAAKPLPAVDDPLQEIMQKDFAVLKSLIKLDVSNLAKHEKIRLFNAENIFPSLHINALSYAMIKILEKRKKSPSLDIKDRLLARLLRNGLIHSKGLYREELFLAIEKSEAFDKFYEEFLMFAKLFLSSIKTHNADILLASTFYHHLYQHGMQLKNQLDSGMTESVSNDERLHYSLQLDKQRLAFSFYIIADEPAGMPLLRENALQMVLTKLQIYGIYSLPRATVKHLNTQRHYDVSAAAEEKVQACQPR